ncbi:hypothetical protein [uncultured Microbacterium sp.]|uniref:hypothetical protein n=1 Tax=uncultured Microbacterium sp. TaxID=191216 RepID=UPI0025F7EFD7|nr:hypothetical protein [uncultured Microbacterium sp.]
MTAPEAPPPASTVEAGRIRERPSRERRAGTLLSLGALVLLIPGVLLATGLTPWTEDRPEPVVAGASGTAEVGDATWGPVKAVILEDTTGLDVPSGSKLIAVKVPVAPHDPAAHPVHCQSPRLVEQRTGRTWEEATLDIGVPYSATEPVRCNPDEPNAALIVAFVVPAGSTGPYWVDVPLTVGDSTPFPRFSVMP